MFLGKFQALIVIWWIGAGITCIALVLHRYEQYAVVGTTGWFIIIASTALIVYEIKRTKEEGKELPGNGKV